MHYFAEVRSSYSTGLIKRSGERDIKFKLSGLGIRPPPWLPLHGDGAYNINFCSRSLAISWLRFESSHTNSNCFASRRTTLFNRDQLFAYKNPNITGSNCKQIIANAPINTVVDVSKAFYSDSISESNKILESKPCRLEKQYKDAYSDLMLDW